MIGVSPTYVPNDYNDVHAGLYSRGGYPPADPPGTFPNNGGLTHLGNGAAGFFGAGADPGAYTSTYDIYNPNQPQPPTAPAHQPRANRSPYDGWKDASEYPSQAPYVPQEGESLKGRAPSVSVSGVRQATDEISLSLPYGPFRDARDFSWLEFNQICPFVP